MVYLTPSCERFTNLKDLADYFEVDVEELRTWENDPRKAVEEACSRFCKKYNHTKETANMLAMKLRLFRLLCTTASISNPIHVCGETYVTFDVTNPVIKDNLEFLEMYFGDDSEWTTTSLADFASTLMYKLADICVGLSIPIMDKDAAEDWEMLCNEMHDLKC